MTETTLIPPRRTAWSLLLHNRLAAFGLLLLAVTLLSALIAPLLPLPDPDATDLLQRLAPPLTPGHLLGTDALGRDMLSRLLWGTRVSVAVGLCGTLIGLIAGYTAGRTDTILMRLIDMIMAFPYILLALAIVAVLGPGLLNALYAIALVNIPFFARNVRGLTLGLRGRDFIQAAQLSGKNHPQILLTEVLPNVLPLIVVTLSTTVGWMILETAGLSFLGLGTQPPDADLGSMLGQGRNQLFIAPHVALVPGVMIFVLVIAFNLLGDGIRDLLDPRLKSGALLRSQAMTRVQRAAVPPRKAPEALLEVVDLQVAFHRGSHPVPTVKGVSFHLQAGECLGLIGESGSGKSVSALAIMGLVSSPPAVITGGSIWLGDEELLALSPTHMQQRRGVRVSYIFQDPLTSLHPQMRVGQQLVEAIQCHQPLSNSAARAKAIALLEDTGIQQAAQRFDAWPHQLSGGQRQRVGIAIALANDPQVIIADEPTTALDVTVQARILALLNDLRHRRGLALLFITHDFAVVSEMCDRVAVMRQGEIVEQGQATHVLQNPQHAYTQRLIASVPQRGQGRAFLQQIRQYQAQEEA